MLSGIYILHLCNFPLNTNCKWIGWRLEGTKDENKLLKLMDFTFHFASIPIISKMMNNNWQLAMFLTAFSLLF